MSTLARALLILLLGFAALVHSVTSEDGNGGGDPGITMVPLAAGNRTPASSPRRCAQIPDYTKGCSLGLPSCMTEAVVHVTLPGMSSGVVLATTTGRVEFDGDTLASYRAAGVTTFHVDAVSMRGEVHLSLEFAAGTAVNIWTY